MDKRFVSLLQGSQPWRAAQRPSPCVDTACNSDPLSPSFLLLPVPPGFEGLSVSLLQARLTLYSACTVFFMVRVGGPFHLPTHVRGRKVGSASVPLSIHLLL